jgi:hypothetical protein
MSKRYNGYITEDSDPFFIERPIQYEHSISTQPPFILVCIEEVVDIPCIGMFVRYLYQLKLNDRILDSFHSLEVLNHDMVMRDQFIKKAEEWLKCELKI